MITQAMFNLLPGKAITWWPQRKKSKKRMPSNLSEAQINTEYRIKDVITDDPSMVNFLFTLGCFKGQTITVISILSENYVINIKDARYSIDADLAKTVVIEA